MIITSHTSAALFSTILKKSDNYLANWAHRQLKIGKLGPYLKDGAGLSRYNLVNIQDLTDEFRHMLQNKQIEALFADQTHPLITNLNLDIPPNTQLIFKSGTLAHVKNLAGVIKKNGKQTYYFTISCLDPMAIDGGCNQAIKDTLSPYLEERS